MDVVACGRCGAKNRVEAGAASAGRQAVCGKCGARLESPQAAGRPETVTDATFEREVLQAGDGRPVLLDCWAAWCGPCRMVGPVIDELASARSDVRFGKLNVDENPRTAAAFGVQSIPLLVFFRDGSEAGRVVGAVPKGQIEAAIQRFLGR